MSSYTYAGLYGPENTTAPGGIPLANTAVTVKPHGSGTLATLYTDRTKATAAANPVFTDAVGNLFFYADPGFYDISANGRTLTVEVGKDVSEPGVSGTPIVRKFPFVYNTASILTGAALYTPTVGDILLDGWIEVDTAWNGTTPKADFGTFTGTTGLLHAANASSVTNLLVADAADSSNAGFIIAGGGAAKISLAQAGAYGGPARYFGKFTVANPIKVCVSQTGANGGADPGASQGAAVLYLITATPT
jgi:hypothetical protein